jgi:hypothetical protein
MKAILSAVRETVEKKSNSIYQDVEGTSERLHEVTPCEEENKMNCYNEVENAVRKGVLITEVQEQTIVAEPIKQLRFVKLYQSFVIWWLSVME